MSRLAALRRRLVPRSLKNKLALIFFGVAALAFAVVIFGFLPRLQTRLENERLEELERVAESSS